MITVELVDDQALVRAGFHALLDSEEDIGVVAEAADGEAAVAQARTHRPDVQRGDREHPVHHGHRLAPPRDHDVVGDPPAQMKQIPM